MTVSVPVAVFMRMLVIVRVTVLLRMIMVMRVAVAMIAFPAIRKVYIKLYAINRTFLPAISAKGIALELEFF